MLAIADQTGGNNLAEYKLNYLFQNSKFLFSSVLKFHGKRLEHLSCSNCPKDYTDCFTSFTG